jgi:lysophospholipase L1-like esterase
MRNFKKIILFIVVFCISIIFFEGFLRTTEIMLPSYVYDSPELGRTHKPSAFVDLVGAEGFYLGRVNEYGYAGKSYGKEKEKNAIRIALIGDSYIEGYQIFERDQFATYLKQNLSKQLNRKVEVLNFGIGGVDLRGMYLRFEKLAKQFNPDMTLFFVKEEDLVRKDVLPTPEPYLSGDSIAYNKDFLNTSDSKLRRRFAFVRDYSVGNLLKEVFEAYHNGELPNLLLDKLHPAKPPIYEPIRKVYTTENDNYYPINKKIFEILSDKSDKRYHPIIVQVEEFPQYYDSLLIKLGFDIFPLKDEFKKYNELDLTYWKASGKIGHWNHFAQGIIGKYLVKEILSSREIKTGI